MELFIFLVCVTKSAVWEAVGSYALLHLSLEPSKMVLADRLEGRTIHAVKVARMDYFRSRCEQTSQAFLPVHDIGAAQIEKHLAIIKRIG